MKGFRWFNLTFLCLFLFICLTWKSSAQGTVQVVVSGVPPVLSSPYISDIEQQYHQGHYYIQVQYNNPDPVPVRFVFEIALSREGEELFRVTSHPVVFTPGNYLYRTFDDTPMVRFSENPVDYLSDRLQEQVAREGIIPEGDYMLEVEVVCVDPFATVASIPSYTPFEVRFPQPPVLMAPVDGGNAPSVFPVFTWTPVIGMPMFQFEYEVLIVEMLEGQTPLQAIRANREHARITTSQPAFIYTSEYLGLETGKQYAWQVRASEINGQIPISDYGRTEIFTFVVSDFMGDVDTEQLERIELVPGFAEVVDLEELEIITGAHSITLNGNATLNLDFEGNGMGTAEIDVYCYDLEIQIGDLENPVVMGGYVDGDISGEILPVGGAGEIVSLERIEWGLAEGLTVDAKIIDPSGSVFDAQGRLNLSAQGLHGSIFATGPSGEPLFEYGEHPVKLDVNSVTATFPGAYLSADAQLRFFNEPTPCIMPNMLFTGELMETAVNCPVEYAVPLVPGSDLATLYLKTVSGHIMIGDENPSFEYSFGIVSSIRLNAPDDSHYDIPVTLDVSSEEGVIADIRAPPLTYSFPDVDLGIAGMQIMRIEDPYIGYDPAANTWDFGFEFDAGLKFPSLDDLELPELYGVTIDREGIHFPSVYFDRDDLFVIPQLSLAGFGARLTSFTIPEFTFPWFDWDGFLPGPWDFEFDFELTFPEFPDYMPPCLRNLSLDVENAGFAGGEFSAVMPSTNFADDECGFDIGAGYRLSVSQLSGQLFGVVEGDEFSIDGYLSVDASMLPGTPFDCGDDSTVQLGAENFTMSSTGIISGEATGIIPACPVSVGPYQAVVTESKLTFRAGGDGQAALFDADAYIEFPVQSGGTGQFGGEFGIDLITGEFTALNFEIDEPFTWTIPAGEEVLKFEIESAAISLDGLMIGGTQEFMAGDHEMAVVFDDLIVDLETFTIKEGSILFDEAFAFEAGIDPGDFSLLYRSVALEDELSLDPGILFGLAGAVQIDAGGLTTAGSADAELAFSGYTIANLSVNFSDDFSFGLDPFKVQEGEIDVYYGDDLVAKIDKFGFDPVLSFFDLEAVIPEHLPVPHTTVAYLVLKDEQGNFLVDVENDTGNDLSVIMETRPGQPVDLVLPVLQGDLAAAPRVGVEFSGVEISLSPMEFNNGQIEVDVSGMSEFIDLEERFGVPLSLEHIAYGKFDDFHDVFNEGLFFTGQLMLFDEQLGENSTVTMFVQEDGTLLTNFDVQEIDRDIPLVSGSDIALININALSGHLEFPLLTGLLPEYGFMIEGGFIVQYEENSARADISAEYDRQGLRLTGFEYDTTYRQPEIDLDPFIFRIDGIRNLHLDYRKVQGFDFYAGLDLSLGMKMEDDEELIIPLKGVEIRPSGFDIPEQEINDGTDPRLMVPPVNLFAVNLQPLAFRMDGAVVDIYNFSPGDLGGLLPRVDFALTFPELESSFPSLAGVSLTINDAGYSNGNFTGSVEVYNPLEPVRIPMGSTFLDIYEFAGDLVETIRDGRTAQGIDINISGSVPGPGIFESDDPCDPVEFSLSIVEGRGFAGRIENFVPCGAMPIGQLSLMFTDSELQFGFEEGDQEAVLAGSAELLIPRAEDESQSATASGMIELDLMTGRLIDGSIAINDAFRWSLPADAEDPFFTFVVNSALLDSEGLTFMAEGDMQVTENVLVDVSFDNLVIGLDDFRIKDGQASISTGFTEGGEIISTGFAFELLFMPVHWRMVPSNRQIPADSNVIRLNLDGVGVTLDSDGLALTGESTANLHLAEKLTEEGEPVEEEEPGDPEAEDIELEFAGLRLALVDNFRFDYRTYAVKSGVAQLWLEEEGEEPDLLAWYDEEGLGLGNILGILPVPDTLGLPDSDIAYLLLRETDPESEDYGDLLVELETGDEGRTLRTKPGKSVKLVLESLGSEENSSPAFLTGFSISVNSAYEIVGGSISVNLENNPFKLPDLPVSVTSLAYERRDDGVGALTAGARLELPESLSGLEIIMDELRFSTEGFEHTTFSVGDENAEEPEFSHSFDDDDQLIINVFYATASFGEHTGFGIKGNIQSSFFRDEDTEVLSSLPFESIYDIAEALEQEWSFEFDLDEMQRDSIAISHARLWLTGIGAVASSDLFTVNMSGTVSLPELLGDDFSVTVSDLSVGTEGIAVGGVDVQADRQEFSLFGDRVKIGVDQVRPDYNNENRVFYIGFDGSLEVLERSAGFTNMMVGTDGSFGIDELDIELLPDSMVIIRDHLMLTALDFSMTGDNQLKLLVDGNATLPEPFSESAGFSVSITQADRYTVDVDVEDIGFRFDEDSRARVNFGDIATFALTAVDLELDFQDVRNTTFYASAEMEIHSDDSDPDDSARLIRFGEKTSITDDGRYGFRYNYSDGPSWNITETFSPSDDGILFGFSTGFFSIDLMLVTMPPDEPDFVVEIGGRAGLNLPALSGSAEFEGFKIAPEGIREFGRFTGEGGLEATLMNVVTLSLGNFEYKEFDESNPYILEIIADEVVENNGDEAPDPDNPVTLQKEVLEYLLIENAGISLIGPEQDNGSGGGNGGTKDAWGGGVERILFYRTAEGISLDIKHANITIPSAAIDVSMAYHTIGGYSLSVAGTGKFGFDDAGAEISVAGKIASINNELAFGLFVKAGVEPGIPVIPAIVTLKGLGGGFYYNPDENDFTTVRGLAGLQYLRHPEFRPGTRFAAFLYAGVGLIGEAEYFVDGDFFMEITDGSTSLHVDSELFYQGERLKAFMFLGVEYGEQPMVQGLCSLGIDYSPALHGGGEIGFFAKPGSAEGGTDAPPVIWAVYGETNIDFFIIETSSDFIVCNDGMLANLNISASYDSRVITLDGSLDASVWYLRETSDMGAFGEINALVSVAGASVQGTLLGALISTPQERFLYAQGEVNVNLVLWEGGASAWAAYSSSGWEAGRGTSPEFEQMIEDSRNQAESLYETAQQAAADVADAISALERAEFIRGLMEDLDRKIQEYSHIEQKRNSMNEKIAYVMTVGDDISERLQATIDYSVEFRDRAEALARDLENPLTYSKGSITGDYDELVVDENPNITVNQEIAQRNNRELEEYMAENIELKLEHYEDAIAQTLLNLRQLEVMIEGGTEITSRFTDVCVNMLGSGFRDRVEPPALDTPLDQHLPGMGGAGAYPSGPSAGNMDMFLGTSFSSIQDTPELLLPTTLSFHYLSENYAQAVESVKDFYSSYILEIYSWHGRYLLELIGYQTLDELESAIEEMEAAQEEGVDIDLFELSRLREERDEVDELMKHAEAAKNLIIEMEGAYEEIFPPLLEMHAAFTGSLDILYTMKAEITATLYGMVEEYFALRAGLPERIVNASIERPAVLEGGARPDASSLRPAIQEEDASAELAVLRDEIVQMLEPPVISSLIVSPGDPGLFGIFFTARNWADIQWQAHHPLNVAETSYLIEPATNETGPGQFTSAGKLESIRHYTWRKASALMEEETSETGPESENTYNISLRARGSGGNTTIRSSTVSLRVRPGGTSTPSGEQLYDDVPPPSTPSVELPYRSVVSGSSPDFEPGPTGIGGPAGPAPSLGSPMIEKIYYTSDDSRIQFSITAHDDQSDILMFEYALGTGEGETDIRDWTRAVGVLEHVGAGGSGVTRRMETTIRGLNLEHGGRYYISVRATNSGGESSEFSMSHPVFYDATPPPAPEGIPSYIGVTGMTATAVGTSSPVTYPVVTEAPSFEPGKVNYPSHYAGEPSITREWNAAEDPESGIWGYEYILTSTDDATAAFNMDGVMLTTENRVTITGDPATYTDSLYLHIRSKNNAGNVSTSALTYGPVISTDNTAPTPPKVNVMTGSNSVKLYIPYLSGDYESQVRGYQYSIGTSPGGTDIRDWGTGIDIDHPWEIMHDPEQVNPDPSEVPVHNIPGNQLPVVERGQLYVNVRAVNGQNMYSPVVCSGPFKFGTRPVEPRVSHNFNSKTGELSIDVQNIFDEGAPVSDVEYRVTDLATGRMVKDWTNVGNFTSGKFTSPRSVTTTSSVGTDVGEAGLAVEVKVTNSMGRSNRATMRNFTNIDRVSSFTNVMGGTGLF